MKKGAMILFSILFLIGLSFFISALLYNNVISEEKLVANNEAGVSLEINPLWSVELQTQESNQTGNLIISFLDIKEFKGRENATLTPIWSGNWYYLNDGTNEYLADTSIIYINMSASSGSCSVSAPDGSCGVSKILLNFNPESEYQSTTFAYNGFISDIYMRNLIENSNSTPQFELNFNPQTGTLSQALYNGKSVELTKEVGFVSYGGFNLLYGTASTNTSIISSTSGSLNNTMYGGSNIS